MNNKNKHKDSKKQNLPNYFKIEENEKVDLLEMQKAEYKFKPITVPKFRLGIDKNNNPLITIDNVLHFLDQSQFEAFLRACINIEKKINPEVDLSQLFK